jgi:raffinose/stachyose/melibiose transport system permease protein
LFLAPALLLYTIVEIYPLFQSLWYSFFQWKGFGAMNPLGLGNYIKMFSDDAVIITALKNVVLFALLSLLIMLPLAFMLAYSIASPIKFSKTFSTIVYLPGIISSVIIGLMWGAILNYDSGFVNTLLRQIGLGNLARVWLGDPKITMYVVIIVNTWQYAGYTMLLFLASMQSIPVDIYEAAGLDGVSGVQRIFRITVPLMTSTIKLNMINMTIGAFKCFDIVYSMTLGGPANSTQTLATYMYENTFRRIQFGYGSAISMLIFVMCIAITLILQKARFPNEDIQY